MDKIELQGVMNMNCYIIANENNDCFIVDPGFNPAYIRSYTNKKGYNVIGILLTHGHFDHICGINCFEVPVYISEKEIELMDDAYLNGSFYYNIDTSKSKSLSELKFVNHGDKIPFGAESIEVFETPGHTRGSLTFKYKDELYTGDTLFGGTVGKWDFPTGNQNTLKETINSMFSSMKGHYKVYPGHGHSSTIADEIKNNYFFNSWKEGMEFPSTVTKENTLFNKARDLFDNRDFLNAKVVFDEIQSTEPENYFISVYVNYCNKMLSTTK